LIEEEKSLSIELSVIQQKKKDLELLINEFDKAPVDEKITIFNNLYDKKNNQGGK
jgi:hypothetical protein